MTMKRLAVFLTLAAAALPAGADDKHADEIDRLARRLERDARELREDVLGRFRKHDSHGDLTKHARELERLAAFIPKLAGRDRHREVREVMGKIDEEVRHIDRYIREMARDKGIDRKAYDHLRDEMTDIGRTLYRIRREL
jgi:hypothetical protein